jgi:hypothetical protein
MANQVQQEWEAWQAYTVGNRKEIGVSYLFVGHELLNNGSEREYISMHGGDGNHFIFRPGHSQYEEIKAKAAQINPENK